MSSGSTKAPKAPDPQTVIDAQTRANRVNQIGPYGSSMYSTDDKGNATQTSTMSPELQAIYQRVLGMSAKEPEQAQKYEAPQGFDQLTSAIGGKVGQRYGLDSAKPTQQPMQAPQLGGSQASRAAMSSGGQTPQGVGSMASMLQQAMQNRNGG